MGKLTDNEEINSKDVVLHTSTGSRYAHKRRIGNWSEDWEGSDTKLKEYMSKKDYGALSISHTQQKFAKSHQRVTQTFSKDGLL
jgi:hypothetical protein